MPLSASGFPGATVFVSGSGLLHASDVAFGETSAAFVVESDTWIRAIVPVDAMSGPITVTTPGGTATSPTSFTVFPKPTLTLASPAVGETVFRSLTRTVTWDASPAPASGSFRLLLYDSTGAKSSQWISSLARLTPSARGASIETVEGAARDEGAGRSRSGASGRSCARRCSTAGPAWRRGVRPYRRA